MTICGFVLSKSRMQWLSNNCFLTDNYPNFGIFVIFLPEDDEE